MDKRIGVELMNDEEKQAIEFLNECVIKKILFEEDFTLHQINIVLNYITKLQKENKELKSDNLESSDRNE